MTREQITALASAVVTDVYRHMRIEAGPDAAQMMLGDMIKTAATISGGIDDIPATTVLEFLADKIEDEIAAAATRKGLVQ